MSDQENMDFEAKAMTVQKDEQKSLVEAVPVDLVEAMINEANRRVVATNKMKSVIFGVTTINDWKDLGGKPYLEAPGAEAVAFALQIGWDKPELDTDGHDDGHKTFEYSGYFHFMARAVWVMGNRSSRDPFFAKSGDTMRPVETINMANVKKSAYTNWLNNGIKRTLGIRNMTWDQLEEAYGIKKAAATSVNYDAKVISKAQAGRLFGIGKSAGWSNDDITKYLAEHEGEYSSSKDILKKDYDGICKYVEANPK